MKERISMVDKSHLLSVRRQCRLLDLNRSTAYYEPKEVSESELELMHASDEIHMK